MEGDVPAVDTAKLTLDLAKLESDVAAKDSEIAELRTQVANAETFSQKSTEDQNALMVRISKLMIDREQLASDREKLEQEKTEAIKTMSQATQLVSDDRDDLKQKYAELQKQMADYEQKLSTEQARNRRAELVTSEFPHLQPFVTDIALATDETAQREAIKAFDAKMSGYLQGRQAPLVAGALQATGGAPVVRTEPTSANQQMESSLQTALDSKDPAAFQAALRAAIEAHQSSVGTV